MAKLGGVTTILKGIYQDEFKWALVKSIGLFALGIRIAQECAGMELLPTQA
ncbi:uncharacterized protein [Diabrotica undecimpunctata]|uniref:uncharacterized protein n=1 Tax=Diabrotica undecimpunctata TaxID=50387 RepID=UPI003B63850F